MAEVLEEWEEYDAQSGIPFYKFAIAGSLAGAAEHCAIFPIDTIKTHLQASTGKRRTPVAVARELISKENPTRLWRGMSTMLYGCIPAHAAYFSIFEKFKATFASKNGHLSPPLAAAASGALATIAHDSIMTPMDVIKQRLQLGFYEGPYHCFRQIVQTEGFRALYLSFSTTLIMNIPFASVMVSANESAKRVLNPNNEYSVSAYLLSGGFAGGIAALLTNPLDVVKTRLQTQNLLQSYPNCENNSKPVKGSPTRLRELRSGFIKQPLTLGARATFSVRQVDNCGCNAVDSTKYTRYRNFTSTISRIYQVEGLKGFSRGALSRVMVHAPSVAISWTTYETAKKVLQF